MGGSWFLSPEEAAIRRWWTGQPGLLVTYLDGDDLLHRDHCRRVQAAEVPDDTQVVCAPLGYLYDSPRERIAPYARPGGRQPPFFTLRYRAVDFFAGVRWHGGPGRHLYVAEHLRAVTLTERLWAQHVHAANDSTRWRGPELGGEERVRVLRALGREAAYPGR
jgi:hypothetical protein